MPSTPVNSWWEQWEWRHAADDLLMVQLVCGPQCQHNPQTSEVQHNGCERQLTKRASASQKSHIFKIRFQLQLKQNRFSTSCCNFPFIGLYISKSTLLSTSVNSWYNCSTHPLPLPLTTNINNFVMPFILPSGSRAFCHQQNPSCNCSKVTPSFLFPVSWIPELCWKCS